jgi:hypothetical protein
MSLFGSLASIAAPIGGFMLGGPLGAGLGGALAGGMNNRKNPLEGALLGGALGYGGAQIPGLLGGADAAVAAPVSTAMGTNAAGASVAANSMPSMATGAVEMAEGAGAATGGGGLLGQVSSVAKPAGQVMSAANSAKSLMAEPQKQLLGPSPIQAPMPNSNLGQMVQGMQQQQANQMNVDFQRREARKNRNRGLI